MVPRSGLHQICEINRLLCPNFLQRPIVFHRLFFDVVPPISRLRVSPLLPQKRTFGDAIGMSAKGQ
jgi:hypothetical protein